MEHRLLKKTGDEVSLLGFGAMRLPVVAGQNGKIDEAAAQKLVDAAMAGGVNYYDTAYGYHEGTSEAFMGKALSAYKRENYFLASKMPMWLVKSPEDALRIFDEQLARCQTEYFDFYLFHSMIEKSFHAMEEMQLWDLLDQKRKEGKIRNLGFSFHDTPEVLQRMCDAHPWDFAQLQLNYFDWAYNRADEQYAILEAHGIPCTVMEPVRGGRLADLGPDVNAMLKKAAPARSIASWAMRWVGAKPNVLCVLSGMTKPDQVEDNLATFGDFAPLSKEEEAVLQQAIPIFKEKALVPCTACRYCMPCPAGVDIPGQLSMYNECAYDGANFNLQARYAKVPKGENAANCVKCGACEAVCPQHIKVSEWMETIVRRGAVRTVS